MAQISDKGIMAIKGNNVLIARLMIVFNKTQNTIENWMNFRDSRLALPKAVQIISEESGLPEDEILEDEKIMGDANIISTNHQKQ